MEKLNRIIIEKVDGKTYEFSGGSGEGGGQPAPDSVGSEEIKDGSVGKVDLDEEVNEGLDELNNVSLTDEELEAVFNGE